MARTISAGQTAPAFNLAGLDGRHYSLKEGLATGPVLAVFFKVTCPTCQFSLPFVERIYQQFHGHAVHVWGISQDTIRDSRLFADHFGVSFPILVDDEPYEISQNYGLAYVPTLFLINPEGEVQVSANGFSRSELLKIQKWLTEYFETPPVKLFGPNERVPEYKPG